MNPINELTEFSDADFSQSDSNRASRSNSHGSNLAASANSPRKNVPFDTLSISSFALENPSNNSPRGTTNSSNNPSNNNNNNQLATTEYVYDFAAAIGTQIESLCAELGHERLQLLTQEIVSCLEAFEKIVNQLNNECQTSRETRYKLEKSRYQIEKLKKNHDKEIKNLDTTIDQLQTTINTLQMSHDTLVDNFDFEGLGLIEEGVLPEDQDLLDDLDISRESNDLSSDGGRKATKIELKLAKKLRLEKEKSSKLEKDAEIKDQIIQELQEQAQEKKAKEDQVSINSNNISKNRRTTSTETATNTDSSLHGSDTDTVSINELQKILRDKNWYKEKCFAMEDQLMEYKMMLANYELSAAGAISGLGTPQHQTSKEKEKLNRKLTPNLISDKITLGPTTSNGSSYNVKMTPVISEITSTSQNNNENNESHLKQRTDSGHNSSVASYFSPVPGPSNNNSNHFKSSTPIRGNQNNNNNNLMRTTSGRSIQDGVRFFQK